uniref:Lymphocyte antigen 6 complex locus G6F n=1 Tax=Macaca mulatta TaxID=9544 RepID=A0A1L6Z9Z1_MACMU|nr:lymphocyte antigen 6 complex locus G6F [Macaca mulatta]
MAVLFLLLFLYGTPQALPASDTREDPGATKIQVMQFPPLGEGARNTALSCLLTSLLYP